jgi:hypothetical protein
VEQVVQATRRAYQGGFKEGGIRFGSSLTTLVKILRDLTSRLRLVGCSLRVVGRLLRDVGHLPGNVGGVPREVGSIIFSTAASLSLLPFSGSSLAFLPGTEEGNLLLRGISKIFPSFAYLITAKNKQIKRI